MFNKKLVLTLILSLVVGSSISSQLSAQQAEPQLIQVNQLQVKPSMVQEFRDVHLNVFLPSGRANGQAWQSTSQTILGKSFEFTIARPIDSLADLDQPLDLNATAALQRARDVWASSVESRNSFVVTSRPDMSLASLPAAGYSINYRFLVKGGMNQQWVALWNGKMLPAFRASGVQGTQVFQTTQGGRVGEFFSRTPVANFSAMAGNGNPFSGLGPEGAAALNAEMWELLDEMELTVSQNDQELSYGLPGMQQ